MCGARRLPYVRMTEALMTILLLFLISVVEVEFRRLRMDEVRAMYIYEFQYNSSTLFIPCVYITMMQWCAACSKMSYCSFLFLVIGGFFNLLFLDFWRFICSNMSRVLLS